MQSSSVSANKGGQLLGWKGEIAEDELSCPRERVWDVAEDVTYCHNRVECYRRYFGKIWCRRTLRSTAFFISRKFPQNPRNDALGEIGESYSRRRE